MFQPTDFISVSSLRHYLLNYFHLSSLRYLYEYCHIMLVLPVLSVVQFLQLWSFGFTEPLNPYIHVFESHCFYQLRKYSSSDTITLGKKISSVYRSGHFMDITYCSLTSITALNYYNRVSYTTIWTNYNWRAMHKKNVMKGWPLFNIFSEIESDYFGLYIWHCTLL
jgi:hypothetical protein